MSPARAALLVALTPFQFFIWQTCRHRVQDQRTRSIQKEIYTTLVLPRLAMDQGILICIARAGPRLVPVVGSIYYKWLFSCWLPGDPARWSKYLLENNYGIWIFIPLLMKMEDAEPS